MVAAGYTMYGSSCNLVLSCGQGVDGFTLDESLGEFILTHPDIKIPSRGKIYSFNEGNSLHFYPPTLKYLESIKYPSNGKPYSARYIGSMVADVHRTLLYGGIFGYPDDKKSKDGTLCMHNWLYHRCAHTSRQAANAVRGVPDVVPHGAGRRPGDHRHAADS